MLGCEISELVGELRDLILELLRFLRTLIFESF